MLFIYLLTAQAIPLMFLLIDDFSGICKEYESGILNITSNAILCHLKAVSVANVCLFIYICPRTTHGISMGLGFWSWNFQGQGVSHNFAEFPKVKLGVWDAVLIFSGVSTYCN